MKAFSDKSLLPGEFFIGKDREDFQIMEEIGRGAHGIVNKVISNLNGEVYVLKKIDLEHLQDNKKTDALKEVRNMRKVQHFNIIQYYTSFYDYDALYIVMEFAESGDLHQVSHCNSVLTSIAD